MHMVKRICRVGAIAILLLVAACSPDDDSQDNIENMQESIESIQPAYAEIEDTPVVIQDPISLEDFEPKALTSNTDVTYDLDLEMEDNGVFHLDAHITVENQSDDLWEHLVFYVIPNAFTEKNKPDTVQDASELEMKAVQVNDKKVPFSFAGDTLAIELKKPLEIGDCAEAHISYEFTVPEDGFRFSKLDNDYFLAQFYPMLATYHDGWNKEDYNPTGESYHTDFGDFTVTYKVPEGYTVFSSSDKETGEESTSGKLEMENIKDFFLAVMETDNLEVRDEEHNGIELRVISDKGNINANNYMDIAVESLQFFEEHIGPYPHAQLDVIVIEDEGGMEYPGIVTVMDNLQSMKEVVVHEIGHQWFYGMVSNDAFHDPFVDEGITDFVTTLYLIDDNEYINYEEMMEYYQVFLEEEKEVNGLSPANLSLGAYDDDQRLYSLVYILKLPINC